MKIRKTSAFGILGLLALVGYAVAQTIPIPTVLTIAPNADLIQVIPRGVPQAGNVYATAAELLATSGYIKVTPGQAADGGVGYVNTFGNYQSYLILVLAGTMPYSYVTLAPSPSDGARECVFAGGGAVTTLYVAASSGQTLDNAVTTLSSNTGVCYTYSLSNLTWDRS